MNEEDMECKVIASLMIMLDDKFSNEAKIQAMKDVKKIFEKQQKEIEELKEKHKKVIAILKKYGLADNDYFFSSTSNIIKFVKDMRKLMGIGE